MKTRVTECYRTHRTGKGKGIYALNNMSKPKIEQSYFSLRKVRETILLKKYGSRVSFCCYNHIDKLDSSVLTDTILTTHFPTVSVISFRDINDKID